MDLGQYACNLHYLTMKLGGDGMLELIDVQRNLNKFML